MTIQWSAKTLATNRNERKTLKDISFNVQNGQLIAIFGTVGSGKVSLRIKCVLMLLAKQRFLLKHNQIFVILTEFNFEHDSK